VRISTHLVEAKRGTIPRRIDGRSRAHPADWIKPLILAVYQIHKAYSPGLHHIMAVLDDCPKMIGRAINGVRGIGPPDHLEPVVNEFAEHGIRVSQVMVGGDPDMLSPATLPEIRRICDAHEIRAGFHSRTHWLAAFTAAHGEPSTTVEANEPTIAMPVPALSSYFVLKRLLDLFATVTALILLLPFWVFLVTVALCDVGPPIIFWQQRLGQGGRPFLLHKIRTLKPPFDWRGRTLTDAERLSAIGRLMRKCRFDELN
jgi:hypothetical protein